MIRVNNELSLYDPELARKPQIVAVNKIDVPGVKERLDNIRKEFEQAGVSAFFISAETGEGIQYLVDETSALLEKTGNRILAGKKVPVAVFRPQPKQTEATIDKDGDIYVINSPDLERIIAGVDISSDEVRRQLQRPMVRYGVTRALEKAGVQPGDKVRCGDYEWEW
jgi:GTP-binding protein